MLRKRTNRQARQGFATQRKVQIVVAVVVVVSLFAAWTMLASPGALDSAFKNKDKKGQTVSIANFNSNSPAKEYIYAGGRLVATEEPASSGCVSPPSPGNTLLATAQTATSVVLNWAPSSGAHHYEVQRRQSIAVGSDWAPLTPNPSSNTFTDNSVGANTSYLYRVRAVDAAGACPSSYSNIDLATTIIFTDDPLVAVGNTIYAIHLLRLRTAVNAVRTTAGLASFDWGDSSLPVTVAPATGGTILKDQVQKLRNRLNDARTALSLAQQPYTNEPLTAGINVFANHILELRQGVQ